MAEKRTYHHGNLAQVIIDRAAEVVAEQGVEAVSLRGLAKDLGVSHNAPSRHFPTRAALLAALATEGWARATEASLLAATEVSSEHPNARLNAMGRGFLRWALENQAMFRTLYHPDVSRFAGESLVLAIGKFKETVGDAVREVQKQGHHPHVSERVLRLFVNAVPTGAALLLIDPLLADVEFEDEEAREELIGEIIDLVVPINN